MVEMKFDTLADLASFISAIYGNRPLYVRGAEPLETDIRTHTGPAVKTK
jgi:hypothetical protein